MIISLIAQVIERCACSDWSRIASCYNHPTQGDYNTEALIFKMAAAQFLDAFEEETHQVKENAVALIITCHE